MNADDPKFTAHVLGEVADLTPAERAEIEAFIAGNPGAAADAAETKALAARLRAELQGESAPALDEKQRAAVLQAAEEIGAKKKVIPIPRRTKLLAAIAACLTVGATAALLLPGYLRHPSTQRMQGPTRHLADLPSGAATRDAGSMTKAEAPAALAQSKAETAAADSQALALKDARSDSASVAASAVSSPAAGGKVEAEQRLVDTPTRKKSSEETETLDRLGKIAQLEEKTVASLPQAAPAGRMELAPMPTAPKANDKVLTERDLLNRIESLDAAKTQTAAAAPAPLGALESPTLNLEKAVRQTPKDLAVKAPAAESSALATVAPGEAGGTMIGSGIASDSPEVKPKQPTIIDALDSKFDQEANQAVFVGEVVVKDPEFNVWCDKLTAFTRHEEKNGKGGKGTAKAATAKANGGKSEPARGGGLDHAIAVCTEEGHRVKIIQDKIDPDTGKMKHGVGFCDWAFYDANTGDIFLHGSPDVTQNSDRCVATAPNTVMTLNRDGHLIAKGPHRTFVIDDSTPAAGDGTQPATPRPASSPGPVTPSPQ